MKHRIAIIALLTFCVPLLSRGRLNAGDKAQKKNITLPVEVVIDKIRGGMLGQMIGNLNGIPNEMRYIDEPGDVRNYVPSLPTGAWTDDDTDFEWVYVCAMQKARNATLSYETITGLWKERINRNIWCANRFARHLMDLGIKPPYTGYVSLNPWAEFNLSGQFLCETFGLIAPAMPQRASRIALNYTRVAFDQEPAQTTQLFATMIATAFVETDIHKIIEAGKCALDAKSEIRQIVDDITAWHAQYPDQWKVTRRLLKEKYTRENGNMRDKNGCRLNTGNVIAALLYGGGDFQESLKASFNFGWDADNNAATTGTILGVLKGYRWMMSQGWQIVDRYRNTTRENMPMDETITSYSDRVIELFEMINEDNGGKKTIIDSTVVYQIPVEQPAPVVLLSSVDKQKAQLQKEERPNIIHGLLHGNREEQARAAYYAVCLDLDQAMSKQYPAQWKESCAALSGYWKVMNNVLSGDDSAGLRTLKGRFKACGFKPLKNKYSDGEIYGDRQFWKDPRELY